MKQGRYKRTTETKEKLKKAISRRVLSGEKFLFEKGNTLYKKRKNYVEKEKQIFCVCGNKKTERAKLCRSCSCVDVGKKIRGEKHPRWKGGVSSVSSRIRQSREYKLWREAVFKKDNFTCRFCNARNGNGKKIILNADHIKSFCDYPKLRFVVDNGRTLCDNCHKKTDNYGWKNSNSRLST